VNKKILIVGDSFASYHRDSWTCHLGNNFLVDNLAANGSSEYRILKTIGQLDISKYNCMIVVHTSPNRIYIEKNPYYEKSATHPKCDLIYEDVCSRKPDKFAENVSWWFENVFDLEHANTVHNLLINHIINQTHAIPALHISFFDNNHNLLYNLHSIWKKYPGDVNHLSNKGNQQVAEFIRDKLKEVV